MNSNNNEQPNAIIKTNALGITQSLNRPTLIVLSLGMSAVPSAFGQINFDYPKTLFTNYLDGYTFADFDRDGFVDFAGIASDDEMAVYLNNGDDTFTLKTIVDQGLFQLQSYTKADDLNGDGYPDLIWRAGFYYGPFFMEVAINSGSDASWEILRFNFDQMINQFAVGDIDGDGDDDIIVSTMDNCEGNYSNNCDRTTFIIENTGHGFLPPRVLYQRLVDPFTVVDKQIGDFDGDGDLDIADLSVDGRYNYYGHEYKVFGSKIDIYINDGAGNFPTSQTTVLPYDKEVNLTPRRFKAADFDGDGDLDLAVFVGNTDYANTDFPAEFLLAVNEGLSQPLSITDATPFGHGDGFNIDAGDLDTDGYIDLVFTTMGDRGVFVFPNNKGRGFEKYKSFPADTNGYPDRVAVLDINNNGQLDILIGGVLKFLDNITLINNPILRTTPIIRGKQARLMISGFQPSEQVWVGMTNRGWGNTIGISFFGGITFDLADVNFRPVLIKADEQGNAEFIWNVPSNAPFGPVILQAGARRGINGHASVKTTFVEAVVQ